MLYSKKNTMATQLELTRTDADGRVRKKEKKNLRMIYKYTPSNEM